MNVREGEITVLGGIAAVPVRGNLDRYWMSRRNFFKMEWKLGFRGVSFESGRVLLSCLTIFSL